MTINNQVLNLKARQILLKSGNGAQVSTYVGPVGEIVFDTSLSTLRIHNGQTVGGVVIPTEDMVNGFANNYAEFYGNLYVTNAVAPYVALFDNINVSIAALNSGLSNTIGNIGNVDLRSLEAIWRSLNFDSNFANVVNTRINGVQANVIIEQTRASLAETNLSSSLSTESQIRANIDTAINVSIATTNSALAAEIAARSAADVVLTNSVANVQANLNVESTVRSLADADLQANINTETAARIQGNIDLHNVLQANLIAESAILQSNINAEAAARIQGNINLHNVLQANILAEQSSRILEIASLHANITASNTRIATLESTESFLVNSASTVDLVSSGNLMIPGHMLPKTHLQQDLGSPSAAWRSLYLAASTMYLGNVGVSTDPTIGLRITGTNGESLPVAGNVKFPDGTTQTTAFLPVFISDLQANLLVERVERLGNVNNLQTQINNILNNTSPGTLDSLAEVVVAYTQMDGNLLNTINTLSTGVYSAIGLEQSRAVLAETLLQANILIEAGARSTQDLLLSIAVGNESNVRAAADSDLSSNISSVNSALTSSISSVNSNVATLSTTVSTILSNIDAVSSNLDIERSQRISNITALSGRIDSVLNNIDPQALDSLSELLTAFTQSDSTLLNLVTNVASVTNTAINSFRIELNAIISDLGITDSNVSYANANIDTLTSRVTSLETNLNIVSNALTVTNSNVTAANSAISALTIRVTSTESNIATLFSNADSQQNTINSLVSNASSQQTTIDSLVSNAASQQTHIDNLWSNASSQQTTIDSLVSNAASQQTTIDSLVSNAASQQTHIDNLWSNASSQQTTIDSLVSNAASQQTTIDSLVSNAASQQTHIDNLWTNAAAQYTAISSLDSNLATANSAIVVLQGNVSNITTRVVNLESNVGQPVNTTSSPAFVGLNLTNANVANIANYGIGYREVPQVTFTSSVTAQTTDSGKHYYSVSASNLVLTLDTHANQPFIVGAVLTVINRGTGTITVTPAGGVSLYLVGNSTPAGRSILSYGIATLMKVENDVWMINGTGVF